MEDAETTCLVIEDPKRPSESIYNELCALAAEGLRSGDPAFNPVRQCLTQDGDDGLGLFIGTRRSYPMTPVRVSSKCCWLT